jgi:hypothetical protein
MKIKINNIFFSKIEIGPIKTIFFFQKFILKGRKKFLSNFCNVSKSSDNSNCPFCKAEDNIQFIHYSTMEDQGNF